MGCQSGKPAATAAHQARPKAPLSPTILERRTFELPTVDVQVLKQENAQKKVMAAPDQPPMPHLEPQPASAENHVVAETRQVENASQMAGNGAGLDFAPERVESSASLSNHDGRTPLIEQSGSKQPLSDTTNLTGNTSGKSPPRCSSGSQRRRRSNGCDCCDDIIKSPTNRKRPKGGEPGQKLELLIQELFCAHDLNGDGLLDEMELIKLNEAVAEVHDSRDAVNVQRKYSGLFREKLDPEGRPVPYTTFRAYILEMLDAIDRNEIAQEMIVEQFLAEARLARTVVTGQPLLVDRPRPNQFYNACLRFCPKGEAATEVIA